MDAQQQQQQQQRQRITCRLMGGLGNQLFQIWTVLAHAHRGSYECVFTDQEWLSGRPPRPTYWTTLLRELAPYTSSVVHRRDGCRVWMSEPHFHYAPLKPCPVQRTDEVLEYVGYFQSWRYFHECAPEIARTLRLADQRRVVLDRFLDVVAGSVPWATTVSVHLRQGDYKTLPLHHPVLPPTYYLDALVRMSEAEVTHVLCFGETQDAGALNALAALVRSTFPAWTVVVAPSDGWADWEQLLLMSACRHHVVANSTFSWWGAYLGEVLDIDAAAAGVTCYPTRWFGPSMVEPRTRVPKSTADLCPAHWVGVGVGVGV